MKSLFVKKNQKMELEYMKYKKIIKLYKSYEMIAFENNLYFKICR